MSNPHLLEIAFLPLDQRAARIASLFSEGEHESRTPVRPRERRNVLRSARDLASLLAFWGAPRRLPAAARALVRLTREQVLDRDPCTARRPIRGVDGFYGFASAPDAETALALLAQGHYCGAFAGLVSLWSPAQRAILRLPVELPLPASRLAASDETCALDEDFDRLLNLCVAQADGCGRKPALGGLLGALRRLGFAHALELRDAEGATQAVVLGVASGQVFSVEGFYARDRQSLSRAVAALAPELARRKFTAVDFREFSPELGGLPIELISRDGFAALLREGADAGIGRWRNRSAPDLPVLRRAA